MGLPEGLDFRKTDTLGLQLVCALVEQLQGKIVLERGKGTKFRIRFNPAQIERNESPGGRDDHRLRAPLRGHGMSIRRKSRETIIKRPEFSESTTVINKEN